MADDKVVELLKQQQQPSLTSSINSFFHVFRGEITTTVSVHGYWCDGIVSEVSLVVWCLNKKRIKNGHVFGLSLGPLLARLVDWLNE